MSRKNFYSKIKARNVKIFLSLGVKAVNSSQNKVKVLTNPQPHLPLHFLIWMQLTSTKVCLQNMVKVLTDIQPHLPLYFLIWMQLTSTNVSLQGTKSVEHICGFLSVFTMRRTMHLTCSSTLSRRKPYNTFFSFLWLPLLLMVDENSSD